jgi:hypothetical protein
MKKSKSEKKISKVMREYKKENYQLVNLRKKLSQESKLLR